MTARDIYFEPVEDNWYSRRNVNSQFGTFGWLDYADRRWEVPEDEEPEQVAADDHVYSLLNRLLVNDKAQVLGFVESNPFLLPFLRETMDRLEQFYAEATHRLELEQDEDDPAELQLIVETTDEAQIAFDKLRNFQETWWIRNLDRARGKLHIYLELV